MRLIYTPDSEWIIIDTTPKKWKKFKYDISDTRIFSFAPNSHVKTQMHPCCPNPICDEFEVLVQPNYGREKTSEDCRQI